MAFIKHFGIENFRIFGKYTQFDFAPITILTGKNNSGKSSLIKAMLLLQDSFANSEYTMDKDQEPLINVLKSLSGGYVLGSFDKILCHNQPIKEKEHIRFSFNTSLNGLPDYFIISLFFKKRDEKVNFGSEGHLTKIEITNAQHRIFTYEWSPSSFDSDFKGVFLFKKGEDQNSFIRIDFSYFDSLFSLSYQQYAERFHDIGFKRMLNIKRKGKKGQLENSITSYSTFDSFNKNDYNWKNQKKWDENEFNILKGIWKKLKSNFSDQIDDLNNGIHYERKSIQLSDIWEVMEFSGADYEQNQELTKFVDQILINNLRDSLAKTKRNLTSFSFYSFSKNQPSSLYATDIPVGFAAIIKKIGAYSFNWAETQFISESLKLFEICDEVEVNRVSELGYEILFKKNDRKFTFHEMGHGSSQIVQLILTIINTSRNKVYRFGDKNFNYFSNAFIVEEPETNLHPDFQSKLADFFILAANTFNTQFIIETHSEYLIRKLQYLTANKKHEYNIKPEDTAIYYFNDPKSLKKGEEQVKRIRIREDGILDGNFGPGFFDEASNLIKEIFKLSGAN